MKISASLAILLVKFATIHPISVDGKLLTNLCKMITIILYAPVAQLDRVSDSDSEGHAFESHRAYHIKPLSHIGSGFF